MVGPHGSTEPGDGEEREILLGWLAFHRSVLRARCSGLRDDQLVLRAAAPSPLSLLGLVRHLAEMERVYGVWANCCSSELVPVWGPDVEWDAGQVEASMRAWRDEKASTDGAIRALALDDAAGANGRTVRWNLHKLLDEYARHNGHADLLRERIDAMEGE